MDGGRSEIKEKWRSRRRTDGTTAKIASMLKRGQVGRSTPVEAAPRQDRNLGVDSVGNGESVEIFQMTRRWIAEIIIRGEDGINCPNGFHC